MTPQGLFIVTILLLLFGAKRLPELARGLGQAVREFSKAKNDISDELMREPSVERPRQIEPVQQAPVQTVQAQPAPNTQPVAQPVAPVQTVAPVQPASPDQHA